MIGEAEIRQACLDANTQASEFTEEDDAGIAQQGINPEALIRVARERAMANLEEEANMRAAAQLRGVSPERISATHLLHMLTAAWAEGLLSGVRLGERIAGETSEE